MVVEEYAVGDEKRAMEAGDGGKLLKAGAVRKERRCFDL